MADINPADTVKEIPEIDLSAYRITPKFEEWRRLYLDKTNKSTFGNATQAAIQAYNLNRETQYGSARIIGHENLSKHNNLTLTIQEYLTENGFTLPVLINHALTKMADPKVNHTQWWKEVMLLAGYKNEQKNIVAVDSRAVINNYVQINGEEPDVKSFNEKFNEFIEDQLK